MNLKMIEVFDRTPDGLFDDFRSILASYAEAWLPEGAVVKCCMGDWSGHCFRAAVFAGHRVYGVKVYLGRRNTRSVATAAILANARLRQHWTNGQYG